MVDFIRIGLLELWRSRVERELQILKFLPAVGFQPVTFCLRSKRNATELRGLMSVEWLKFAGFTWVSYI